MQRRNTKKPISRRRRSPAGSKARKAAEANAATLQDQVAALTRELKEAREQQAATGEILASLTGSIPDAKPVFDAIIRNLQRLFNTRFAMVQVLKDGMVHVVAAADEAEFKTLIEQFPRELDETTSSGRAMISKQVLQFAPVRGNPAVPPVTQQFGGDLGFNSVIFAPMTCGDKVIGAIATARREPEAFDEKQIALIKAFADQAVIAIENARLLNELRQRTNDLSEALQQQTATSEVLQVINSSPGKLEPVFQAMLENATRICGANFGLLYRSEGDVLRTVAMHGVPPALVKERQRDPIVRPAPATGLGQALAARKPVQIADVLKRPEYFNVPAGYTGTSFARLSGARTVLGVPMLKDNELVGAITIFRKEVRLFTDKQIELVKNFAAQAVIAIENTRLLNDLNKLNQQLEQRVTDQVSEIERMGRLRRFLSPQVADLIVASGAEKQLESHRREITALFCDLRGFTGFSESSDPEDVMALLREYHAAIGEIINTYGGTLERYAGDGVMVVFNDPIPVDNPALQAVLMAIDMRAAIGELIEKWRKLGHDIGFGIGIAHGFATLGTIGFEGRFDYAAIGTVSNVASRLCDEAKPGQILISPRVLMAVEKDITVEPVGDFALKGIRRPLTAYNVLETKAAD